MNSTAFDRAMAATLNLIGLQARRWQALSLSGESEQVVFMPRDSFNGRPAMPELLAQRGVKLQVRPLWLMTEGDPYPGEWALGAADGCSDLLGRAWIASGDVVICPVEVN